MNWFADSVEPFIKVLIGSTSAALTINQVWKHLPRNAQDPPIDI